MSTPPPRPPSAPASAEAASAETASAETASAPPTFVDELLRRRLPHIALGYLGGAWTFFQFVQWSVRRYELAAAWEEATLFGLLLLLPSVLLLAYRHGAPGRQRWRRLDLLVPAANLLVVAALGALLLGRAPQEPHLLATAGGVSVAETAPVPPQVGLFAFRNASGDAALDWLRTGIPLVARYDLGQDPGVGVFTGLDVLEYVRRSGVQSVYDVPLTVQRDVARVLSTDYLVLGTFGREGSGYTLGYELHEVATGSTAARRAYAGPELLGLVDSLTAGLRADLGLTGQADVADLPVRELLSPSLEAVRAFAESHHLRSVDYAYEEADARAAEAVRIDPAFAAAHLHRYSLNIQLQRQDEAQAALAAAQQHRYRLTPRQQYAANYIQLVTARQPDEARVVLDQWLGLAPDDPSALYYAYSRHVAAGEMEEGIRRLRRLIDVSPQHRQYLATLGDYLRNEGRYDEARAAYEAFIEAFPTHTQGYVSMGYLDAVTGRWEEALDAYVQGVAADPNHYLPHVYLLDAYTRLGRYDEAARAADKALALARTTGDSIAVLSVHATFHARRGAVDGLRAASEQKWALEARRVAASDVLHSRILAAAVFAELGAAAEARALVEAVMADPSVETATDARRMDLAWHAVQVTVAEGEAAPARRALDAFIAQSAALAEAYGYEFEEWEKAQGRLQILEGDAEAAVATLTAFAEDAPLDYEAHRLLGDAYRLAGDVRAAESHYRVALRLYPEEPHAHLGLARLFDAVGRRGDARTHVERALAVWRDAHSSHPERNAARVLAARLGAGEHVAGR